MTNPHETHPALEFALKIARAAGAYQKSKYNTSFQVEFKTSINLLTEVDKACEKLIVDAIHQTFPLHDILAEEGGGERKDSPFKWIIDPLDGTTNFAHGYPLFCVSIGLEYKGEILLGVVYEPLRDEMFHAVKGEGAFLNNQKIFVSKAASLGAALMGTGFAYNLREAIDNNLDHFQNIVMRAQGVRRDGVAAVDLCYVACGRYDGFWELNLFPWDTAAGLIMVQEAGGTVTRFDGSPYTPYEKDILATNALFHDEMIGVLKGA